jgi:Cu+-exporting ATPase
MADTSPEHRSRTMEKVNWKVEGMTCSNCVLTINRFLENKGMQNIKLTLAGGDLSFDMNGHVTKQEIEKGIQSLGYRVVGDSGTAEKRKAASSINPFLRYLFITAPFTIILLLHMFDSSLHIHWLMNPWIQFLLCLPVYITGMSYFGKSAINSIRNRMPNMNVLVSLGATAAFFYSLTGTVFDLGPDYLFYETAAAIICFVFLGNYLEDVSVRRTQAALDKLAKSQKVMANMIAFDDQHQEHIFPVEGSSLKPGDLILIKSGEQIPTDCKILWGEGSVNESIITGESLPLTRVAKDKLIGGSLLLTGTLKAQVTAATKDSVLSGIIRLVQEAQGEKPPVQQLADRISAVFVPVVLTIAALTFVFNLLYLHTLTPSLMRCIAVLVIACPCAMGLATPAAIAVGLGRAARNGILFRNAKSLELFKDLHQVIFDKTGTLTTGEFELSDWAIDQHSGLSQEDFKRISYSLEKYSSHPIAKSISKSWKTKNEIRWKKVEEVKGMGMKAVSKEGEIFWAGSYKTLQGEIPANIHSVYVSRNGQLLGWINVRDQVRPEAAKMIDWLHQKNIHTVILSGDHESNCQAVAAKLKVSEVISGQNPEQKLRMVELLTSKAVTAMVGDGINDAPALAKASIGISLSDASHLAIQTSDVVLMDHGLKNLPLAIELGKYTYDTIRQNLFWAFFYNIIAIPVAAFGWLTPAFGALAMGFSDLVLVGNSIRLFVRKTGVSPALHAVKKIS